MNITKIGMFTSRATSCVVSESVLIVRVTLGDELILPPILSVLYYTCPLHTKIVGVGKERRTLVGPWGYLKRQQHPLLELTTLRTTGPVPVDSRQRTPSVRNCVTR